MYDDNKLGYIVCSLVQVSLIMGLFLSFPLFLYYLQIVTLFPIDLLCVVQAACLEAVFLLC